MTITPTAVPATKSAPVFRPSLNLAAALLGFFVVTLDAVVVNVALPTIRVEFGGGLAGLQWVVDGYTLMFAALLLSAGSLADRIGARRAFGSGLAVFMVASVACGMAPNLAFLVGARFVQGSAAAAMMPASMAIIGQAYRAPGERARAVGLWAMGGALATSTGPIVGGLLTVVSWRAIFFINLPVGAAALLLLRRTAPSPRRQVPFDVMGQVMAVLAMGGLTYGAIEAGVSGFGSSRVIAAFIVAVLAIGAFIAAEAHMPHPMVPLDLFRVREVSVTATVGFAFMVGYFGLPFVFSLYFQQLRGFSALQTGALFLPMALVGAVLTPSSHRLVSRFGARRLIVTGLGLMAVGLVLLGLLPRSTPIAVLSGLMVLVGLSGPLISPPATALLLNGVHEDVVGAASGIFNTSRQVGGALAVAVFGALLGGAHFTSGLRTSLLIAALVAALAAITAVRLRPGAEPPQGRRASIRACNY